MTIAQIREDFGVPGPWLFRLDIPLASAFRIVLIHDTDGELVIRMMEDTATSRTYVTPKVRVEAGDLMDLMGDEDVTFRQGPIEIRLRGEFADVRLDGKHGGNCPRGHLARGVKAFLYVTEDPSLSG